MILGSDEQGVLMAAQVGHSLSRNDVPHSVSLNDWSRSKLAIPSRQGPRLCHLGRRRSTAVETSEYGFMLKWLSIQLNFR